jgi:hypothetical protein
MLRHTNTKLVYELYGHPDDDAALDEMRKAWASETARGRSWSSETSPT